MKPAGLAKAAGRLAKGRASFAAGMDIFRLGRALAAALEAEWDEGRLFLWIPVAAGAGVLLYLAADREPVAWLPAVLACAAASLGYAVRMRPVGFSLAVGVLALLLGFLAAEWRTWRIAAPALDRTRIVKLTGFIEQVDPRITGARFVLLVRDAEGLEPRHRPTRVRLTTRRPDRLQAGMFVAVTARLLPPSRAAVPGGYAFARDAFFAGLGAVGSALGRVAEVDRPGPPDLATRSTMALDRARNELAARVDRVVGGGDVGAVAAAMVTGKRDLLSQDGRDIIRQAGIFHIITIAGVQMTLVAALFFGGLRRIFALNQSLALAFPIKKLSALAAILGALAYDLGTGSRIGTQRAFFMTLVMLGAVLFDRRALTMRNLALAALAVIAFEPEAIAGASFQLSFAAVAALIMVQEARTRRAPDVGSEEPLPTRPVRPAFARHARGGAEKVAGLFIATLCATAATASFMAAAFHELSPYVFIGNPLTLAMIEFFAVPGALLGTFLYPLGLDAPVWHWVGLGIRIVLWVAGHLANAPGATVHLRSFAPWALPCLTLGLLSVVIWRTTLLRLTSVPLLVLGLAGTASGDRFDLLVPATGDAVAIRDERGLLGVVGRSNAFTVEQWLRADGDGRTTSAAGAATAFSASRCDRLACVASVPGGGTLSLVSDAGAFEEDCRRADIIVTPLYAPSSCGAELIVDRGSLEETGAVALARTNGAWRTVASRATGEDRPWSPAPAPERRRVRADFRATTSAGDDGADGGNTFSEPDRAP